jgi:hypothetical protein
MKQFFSFSEVEESYGHPTLPHVPAESIVRLGLSMVAYSAFNDTLRRNSTPQMIAHGVLLSAQVQ